MSNNDVLYGQTSGRYEVTTKVFCNCEGKEPMEYEVIHFNPERDSEPIHTYYCNWCGGDFEIDDIQLRDKEGEYKKEYLIYI